MLSMPPEARYVGPAPHCSNHTTAEQTLALSNSRQNSAFSLEFRVVSFTHAWLHVNYNPDTVFYRLLTSIIIA